MNSIIVWNDLPLVYGLSLSSDYRLSSLFNHLHNPCLCDFCSYELTKQWSLQWNEIGISIGRRPQELYPNTINIVTKRIKNKKGKAVGTYIIDDENAELLNYLEIYAHDKILIYEDAIVEGNTIALVIEKIRCITAAPISIICLFALEESLDRIMKTYSDVTFNVYKIIKGSPIIDCTVLFCSDLIEKDSNLDIPFICNKELMIPCFYDDYSTVLLQLKSFVLENILECYLLSHCKRNAMKHTLYVCDLDDTLTENGKLSNDSLINIRELIKKEIPFSIATARSYMGMMGKIQNTVLETPTIHYNGALIYNGKTKSIEYINCFLNQNLAGVLKKLCSRNSDILCISFVQGHDKAFIINRIGNANLLKMYNQLPNEAKPCIVSLEEYLRIGNCITIYEYTDNAPLFDIGTSYNFVGGNQYISSVANKGLAVKIVGYLISADRITVFGDSENDYSMFSVADEAYALCDIDEQYDLQKVKRINRANDIFLIIQEGDVS